MVADKEFYYSTYHGKLSEADVEGCLALAEQPASRSGSARERDHASDGHDGYSLVVGVANRKLARL